MIHNKDSHMAQNGTVIFFLYSICSGNLQHLIGPKSGMQLLSLLTHKDAHTHSPAKEKAFTSIMADKILNILRDSVCFRDSGGGVLFCWLLPRRSGKLVAIPTNPETVK